MTRHAPVTLTDAARERLARLRLARGANWVRLYVHGAGCAGFSYGFALEDVEAPEDWRLVDGDCRLLVDLQTAALLDGSLVDWVDDLQGARLVVNNPRAATTCGCGSSFMPSEG